MWKLFFVARRAWKLVPKEHRRTVRRTVTRNVRAHGPTIVRGVRESVRHARRIR